jgi:hypothetical protein
MGASRTIETTTRLDHHPAAGKRGWPLGLSADLCGVWGTTASSSRDRRSRVINESDDQSLSPEKAARAMAAGIAPRRNRSELSPLWNYLRRSAGIDADAIIDAASGYAG